MAQTPIADSMRAICEQQGLQRALELFPATIAAAAERGLQPLASLPGGFAPVTAPATVLNTARGGERT